MHPSACEGIMWFKITGHSGTAIIGQLNNYNIWNGENKMYSIYHRMAELDSISQIVCSFYQKCFYKKHRFSGWNLCLWVYLFEMNVVSLKKKKTTFNLQHVWPFISRITESFGLQNLAKNREKMWEKICHQWFNIIDLLTLNVWLLCVATNQTLTLLRDLLFKTQSWTN